jgi:NAD-dependent SIR2 family protein deacetylase
LIQDQFDKAEASGAVKDDDASLDGFNERPSKRRRTSKTNDASYDDTPTTCRSLSTFQASPVISFPGLKLNKTQSSSGDAASSEVVSQEAPEASTATCETVVEHAQQMGARSSASAVRPVLPRHSTEISSESCASNDSMFSALEMSRSSTQTDLSIGTPKPEQVEYNQARTPVKNCQGVQFSSSPLSSPPPILFDPYERSEEPTDGSSECSESEESEQDEESTDFLASQTSQARLRTMKGRDLFDSNIWSDPLKTSVFYRFATTLRQKVKDVEPTTTHHFIARLRDIGKLTRVYTQNIDEIEKKIGLSTDLKVGAGNKRRKSAKQQRFSDCEPNGNEESMHVKDDEDATIGKETSQSSQASEGGDTTKQRTNTPPDKGVECVFLHGSLQALRCFVCARLCDWDAEDREALTMSGEQPECPHCAGATAARQERGKRALGVGKLRPDIVLYGEEHPQSDLISPIVQHDLSNGPDLMLVLGTSLKVHGLKVMVREFARAVHQKGGKVVFINFTKPSESIWGDVIDYWVQWDCDAWVNDLKERKPTLWMSPDAIVEYEKLKRGELAEKRREAAGIRKRESQVDKKRESGNIVKRRATFQAMEEKSKPKQISVPTSATFRSQTQEPKLEVEPELLGDPERKVSSKLREPAKNPQAERNDYNCGAYCMSKIADAFYMIRGEKFDFFGYTPSKKRSAPAVQDIPKPETSRRPAVRTRRPRHSAPAILPVLREPLLKTEHRRPAVKTSLLFDPVNKDKFKKAASELFSARRPHTLLRISELRGQEESAGGIEDMFSDFQLRTSGYPESHHASVPPSPTSKGWDKASIVSQETTLVSAPVIQEDPLSISVSAAVKSNPRKRRPTAKAKTKENTPSTPVQSQQTQQPRAMCALSRSASIEQENVLPPFRVGTEPQTGPRLATMEPAFNPSPPHSPLDQTPLASLSPNQRRFSLQHFQHPMMLSSPLIKLPFGVRKESTPSPSDQLREEAAIALSGMRLCR